MGGAHARARLMFIVYMSAQLTCGGQDNLGGQSFPSALHEIGSLLLLTATDARLTGF